MVCLTACLTGGGHVVRQPKSATPDSHCSGHRPMTPSIRPYARCQNAATSTNEITAANPRHEHSPPRVSNPRPRDTGCSPFNHHSSAGQGQLCGSEFVLSYINMWLVQYTFAPHSQCNCELVARGRRHRGTPAGGLRETQKNCHSYRGGGGTMGPNTLDLEDRDA